MEKVIVDDKTIRDVINDRYEQNHKVIDLSDLDTSKCTDFSRLFNKMTDLEEIKGFNTLNLSNVRNMSRMCYDCRSLKQLDLSGLDLHNVMTLSVAFYGCESLKELNLSGLGLSNVRNMYRMCSFCHALEKLDLSDVDLSNVICMRNRNFLAEACEACYSLIDFKVDEQYFPRFRKYNN